MALPEFHDGSTWQSVASETYVQNRISFNNTLFSESNFSNVTFYITGNVATQALAANTWTKLTYTASTNGIILNNNNSLTSQNLFSVGTNRITKTANTPFFNNNYSAVGSAVISSSSFLTHNISLQIVKNGVLSSIVPYGFPTRVAQNGVAFGYKIDTSFFQLNPTDYIELYGLSTVGTTITTSTMMMNLNTLG